MFQPTVGVSWVQRHGATKFPRGRHLREGRISLSHGKSPSLQLSCKQLGRKHQATVRQQQPPDNTNRLHMKSVMFKNHCADTWDDRGNGKESASQPRHTRSDKWQHEETDANCNQKTIQNEDENNVDNNERKAKRSANWQRKENYNRMRDAVLDKRMTN